MFEEYYASEMEKIEETPILKDKETSDEPENWQSCQMNILFANNIFILVFANRKSILFICSMSSYKTDSRKSTSKMMHI